MAQKKNFKRNSFSVLQLSLEYPASFALACAQLLSLNNLKTKPTPQRAPIFPARVPKYILIRA